MITEAPGGAERSITWLTQSMSTSQKESAFNQELVISECATTTTNFIETDISPSPKDQANFCLKSKLIHANIFIVKTFVGITRKPYFTDWATFFSKIQAIRYFAC